MKRWLWRCARVALLALIACRKDADPDRQFWDWFVASAPGLAREAPEQAMDKIQFELTEINLDISGEIAWGSDGSASRTLVLSAGGKHDSFPAVQELYAARPQIAGWNVIAFRPRTATRPMPVVVHDGRSLAPSDIKYVAVPSRGAGKLDVSLYVPGYQDDDAAIGLLVFLALDHCVGEYDVETRIGVIHMLPLEQAPANARSLDNLPADVDAIGSAG